MLLKKVNIHKALIFSVLFIVAVLEHVHSSKGYSQGLDASQLLFVSMFSIYFDSVWTSSSVVNICLFVFIFVLRHRKFWKGSYQVNSGVRVNTMFFQVKKCYKVKRCTRSRCRGGTLISLRTFLWAPCLRTPQQNVALTVKPSGANSFIICEYQNSWTGVVSYFFGFNHTFVGRVKMKYTTSKTVVFFEYRYRTQKNNSNPLENDITTISDRRLNTHTGI